MDCLGFEPGAAGWWAQTIPRSYGGHTNLKFIIMRNFCIRSSEVTRIEIRQRILYFG